MMPFEHVSIKPKYIFTVTYSIQLDKSAWSFEKVLTLYGFGFCGIMSLPFITSDRKVIRNVYVSFTQAEIVGTKIYWCWDNNPCG